MRDSATFPRSTVDPRPFLDPGPTPDPTPTVDPGTTLDPTPTVDPGTTVEPTPTLDRAGALDPALRLGPRPALDPAALLCRGATRSSGTASREPAPSGPQRRRCAAGFSPRPSWSGGRP
jgi:hypothetical protein